MEMNTNMIHLRAAALLLATASLVPVGCERMDEKPVMAGGNEIRFDASVGRVLSSSYITRAAGSPESQGSRSFTLALTSDDGSVVIPVTVVETEMADGAMTRGRLINGPLTDAQGDDAPIPLKDSLDFFMAGAYLTDSHEPHFDNTLETVSWDGSSWCTEKTYYWPQATSLDVYAHANMPAPEYAAVTVNGDCGNQKLTYTVPRDAKDQKDILMAMYTGTGDNAGRANLTFYHPLTAVQFSRAGSMDISGITEIVMSGVNYGGEVTQSMTTPATFSWTVSDKEATVSQDNDGKPFEVHGEIDGDPFLLVPQSSAGSRSVVLTVTLIYKGHEIPLNAVISDMHWLAGRTYTYRIGYSGDLEVGLDLKEIPDDDAVKGPATISNAGSQKCYVRAVVDGLVTDRDGFIKRTYLGNEGNASGVGAFTVASGTFGTGTWNTAWVRGDDGFYYYKKPLSKDESTTHLFDGYTFSDLGEYESYEMAISTQAIMWDASKAAVKAAWGEAAAELLQ